MKLNAACLYLLLGSCAYGPGNSAGHVRIPSGPDTRLKIVAFSESMQGIAPTMLFDERTGTLNVFARGASFGVIARAAKSVGLNALPGLEAPPTSFLAQTKCGPDEPCEVDAMAACRVRGEVGKEAFENFHTFARFVNTGGYASLGVLFDRHDNGSATITVPMYDQCSLASDQLSEAWRLAGGTGPVHFVPETK